MPDITGGAPALVTEQAIECLPGWHKTEPGVHGPTRQLCLMNSGPNLMNVIYSARTLLPLVRMAFPLPLADAGESEGRPKMKTQELRTKI